LPQAGDTGLERVFFQYPLSVAVNQSGQPLASLAKLRLEGRLFPVGASGRGVSPTLRCLSDPFRVGQYPLHFPPHGHV
jgi:hypothetical protein